MKAVEVTGEIDAQGHLTLDQQVLEIKNQRVRVIILATDVEEAEFDPDDPPVEAIQSSLRKALHQARTEQTIPLSQLWDGIENDAEEP